MIQPNPYQKPPESSDQPVENQNPLPNSVPAVRMERKAGVLKKHPEISLYVGAQVGHLTLLEPIVKEQTYWKCRCVCGRITTPRALNLRAGKSKSCGCQKANFIRMARTRHGHAKDDQSTSEYRAWSNIRDRIYNPRNIGYKDYGGRGIRVCSGLSSFENFLRILGLKPSTKHSLDRINNDGHYSCGECEECRKEGWTKNIRWATLSQQCRNMRRTLFVTYRGVEKSLPDWTDELGLSYTAVLQRLRSGWSVEKALSTPVRKRASNRIKPTPQSFLYLPDKQSVLQAEAG